jgi:MoaA/NifB/PqqE/SkfB family radical SAM enzyme
MIGVQIMSDIDLSKHVAVSPHNSIIHAINKDPQCIQVTWFLGKRCNFDCSYCSSLIHDNFSNHIKISDAFTFLDNLNKHCIEKDKKFNLSITGGEPFVHPEFTSILKYAHSKVQLFQQGVVTNGSIPLDKYQEAMVFLNWMTVSLHLEQKIEDINNTVDKIIILNKNKKVFLNVNIMALPGKFEYVEMLIKKLSANSVKYVLKKIDPPDKENNNEWHQGNIDKKLINTSNPFNASLDKKIIFKKINSTNIKKRQQEYYSKEEIDFLSRQKDEKQWPNLKLYFDNEVILINSEDLKKQNLNRWKNWHCYVGIESLYIEYDGTVYRGMCMQGNKIGHISDKIYWPTQPIVCPLEFCGCQTDMCTKKVKKLEYLNKLR